MEMVIQINAEYDKETMIRIGAHSGGADGLVYRSGDDKVAKFQWPTCGESWLWRVSPNRRKIQKEYEIARRLY